MSFRPINDKEGEITSKTLQVFSGVHGYYSEPDKPDEYAETRDFDCVGNKLKIRPGCRKNSTSGYTASVTGTINVGFKDSFLFGWISNGSLSLRPVADILAVLLLALLASVGISPSAQAAYIVYFPTNYPLSYTNLNNNFSNLNVNATYATNWIASYSGGVASVLSSTSNWNWATNWIGSNSANISWATNWVILNSGQVAYVLGQTNAWNWATNWIMSNSANVVAGTNWIISNSGGVASAFSSTNNWNAATNWVIGNSGQVAWVLSQTGTWATVIDDAITNNGTADHLYTTTSTGYRGDELVAADWVRSLFSGGQFLYNITNRNPVNTNFYIASHTTNDSGQVRTYSGVTNNQYLTLTGNNDSGGIMYTSKFYTIYSPMNVNVYMSWNYNASRSASVKAEFYYSCDGTNFTEVEAAAPQPLKPNTLTNLYQYTIPFPTIVTTCGVYVARQLKVSGVAGTVDISVHGSGNYASHISFSTPPTTDLGIRGATGAVYGAGTANSYDATARILTLGTGDFVNVAATNNCLVTNDTRDCVLPSLSRLSNVWINTTGNIGISTNNPQAPIHIRQTDAEGIRFTREGYAGYLKERFSNNGLTNTLAFDSDSVSGIMVIQADGDVVIGTNPPSGRFHVAANGTNIFIATHTNVTVYRPLIVLGTNYSDFVTNYTHLASNSLVSIITAATNAIGWVTNGLASVAYVDAATNAIGWVTNGLASTNYVHLTSNSLVSIINSSNSLVADAQTNYMKRDGSYPATGAWDINRKALTNLETLTGTGEAYLKLYMGTDDGDDDQRLEMGGGGYAAPTTSRGGAWWIAGNENAGKGSIALVPGIPGSSTGSVYIGLTPNWVVFSNDAVWMYPKLKGSGYLISNAADFAQVPYTNAAVIAWDSGAGKFTMKEDASGSSATNGLASIIYVDAATNGVNITSTNQAYIAATNYAHLASNSLVTIIDAATNAVRVTATNQAVVMATNMLAFTARDGGYALLGNGVDFTTNELIEDANYHVLDLAGLTNQDGSVFVPAGTRWVSCWMRVRYTAANKAVFLYQQQAGSNYVAGLWTQVANQDITWSGVIPLYGTNRHIWYFANATSAPETAAQTINIKFTGAGR